MVPIIETKNLTKSYGKNRGIIDVNLNVNEGEIFGFIGPNGAGKSTFIRSLLNFVYPTSGSGRILNKDIATESKSIKKEIGYVPSEVKYYAKSYVRDIIQYTISFKEHTNKKEVENLVENLDIDINKRIEELSLGNKKKLSIMQALIGDPKILILDEPTNGLDPLMQKRLFKILRDFRERGRTVFLSSHNLTEIENLCNRVAIIREGRIIDTMDLQEKLGNFGRIIEVEGDIPKEYIEGLSDSILFSSNDHYKFIFKGEIDGFIKSLGQYKIRNLSIKKENLEDAFMKYYENQEGL